MDVNIFNLKKGDEAVSEITQKLSKSSKSGMFWGIGAFSKATLKVYDLKTKQYKQKEIVGNLEVASLNGILSYIDKKPTVHVHACLSDENFNCYAGHLEKAVVGATLEVGFCQSNCLERRFNKEIGLNLLNTKED